MVTIADDIDSLNLQEPVFKDVKYYLSGDVSERILLLLQSGGAENTKYFSDYVTHLICGHNASETDIEEAQDIYQIPAVTENWVVGCVRLKKLANPKPYSPGKHKIFNNVTACLSKVSVADAKTLFALITYNGGNVKLSLDSQCTHLICGSASGKKYSAALNLSNKFKIVTPDWVLESLRARIQAVTEVFHPKLLIVPQPPPKPMDRISAITGFDFEEGIAKNEVPTQNMAESKDDSTQALLDKLKQRMPWNHPASTASGITTSTVSSMGYTTTSVPTSGIMSKTMPQGIVSQNMQIPSSQSNTQIIQKFVQNAVSSQAALNMQQQNNLQQQIYNQHQQQQQPQLQQQQSQHQQQIQHQQPQQQPHGLTAIQIQQQKLLQQHLRMQMLQQQNKINNQQNQQFSQQSTSVSQINQNISGQIQHVQNQHHLQNISQTPTTMTSAQQQIENISQMLSQSANNLQQQQINQQNLAMKQQSLNQQTASQAVQNIAQQLAQSTQNLQQSLQNAKLNQQNMSGQVINQQLINSAQNQGMIQQQTVQSMTNQQQNLNMGVVNQQGLVTSQSQSQNIQLNQIVGNNNQQMGQQIQSVQNIQSQGQWRQQNIQMVQNVQGQHQIIRSPLVQRTSQNQVILQQHIMQSQQQGLNQTQLSPQQQPQQIIQQSINSQGQAISQTHHQILVQKQQLLNNSGQQQIVQPQQVLINQHTGQQQILVHGNQQVTLQGQQLVSQSQIVQQGGQLVNQSGQQILTQGSQVLSQGGQHVITQQGQQHQVVIAQSSQQIVSQSGQQIVGQGGQQVLSQVPQSPQPGQQITGGGIQQIITHSGGQPIVSPGGQQIVQGGQNVSWQQQQYLQQRQQLGQPGTVGPRVSWTAGGGGRQLIHLDAQTHAQLQQMDPKQRAMFVAQLQKRRQLSLQRAAAIAQQQQPGVVPGSPGAPQPTGAPHSVTFIRSQLPPGLNQQQQVQWLQQQGARASIPAASPAQPPQSPGVAVGGGAPVGSPGPGSGGAVESQLQQLQMQRQQQFQRLQQLQAQRDHVAHHHKQQVAPGGVVTQHAVGASPISESQVDGTILTPTTPDQQQGAGNTLLVNPKTKTALANMLSVRLQGAATPVEHEPSAAGTLRLMTAAHAAGGAVRAPARLLLGPTHHPHQATGGVVGAGNKVFGVVRGAAPRAQFYGHNPNLKLPPELFLLGCVFHIVEYQQSWGAERVARWSEAIQRRGGELEHSYCARVTHVLCETQKHGVVMQALRDAKRCVTAYWLSDAMLRRSVAPPWQALHLPTMYSCRERPATHHRACISGWRGEERERLAAQVSHVGAKLTPYMTRDNTVLICKRAEGNKYRRAREWGIPIVTAAWLTDLLLGNMSALSQIENAKYQQFNLPSPFRMDYSLVSPLMNAWKMPINITQESHERAKRSAAAMSQRRAKRPRLASPPRLAPPSAPIMPVPLHLAPRVLFSAISPNEQAKLAAVVRQLGGLVVTSAAEATHLVMDKLIRTCKLVSCLVTVKHLLSPEWVHESQRLNKFADEAKHGLRDEAFNSMFKCDVSEVLLCGEQRKRLFEGITFFLTPCVKPSRSALVEMIELCGGKVEKNRRSFVSIQEMHTQRPFSYLVLTAPNDLHLVYYLLQSEKTLNVVCSSEVVLSAILRQKLEIHEFLVKVD